MKKTKLKFEVQHCNKVCGWNFNCKMSIFDSLNGNL